jgi:hypothetical protein
MMRQRLTSLIVIISLLGTWAVLPIRSAEAQLTGIPVTGQAQGTIQGAFDGLLTLQQFVQQGNQLLAEGTLTIAKQGQVVSLPVTLPVSQIQVTGTCEILHLVLGPLDLNLLGLEIHLNRVVLDIVANPAGGLLGQLLCAIANLLPPSGNLAALIDLLNQILDLLG